MAWLRNTAAQHVLRRITEGVLAGIVTALFMWGQPWWGMVILVIMVATLVIEVRNLRRRTGAGLG
jgi:hypothetical protein